MGAIASGDVNGDVQHLFSRVSVEAVECRGWTFGLKAELIHSNPELDALSESGAGPLSLITHALDRDASQLNLTAMLAREYDTKEATELQNSDSDISVLWPASFRPAPTGTSDNPLGPFQYSGFDVQARGGDIATGFGIDLCYNSLFAEYGQDLDYLSLNLSVQFHCCKVQQKDTKVIMCNSVVFRPL